MANSGPILVVEDDLDDQEMIESAFREIGQLNKLVIVGTAAAAYEFLLKSEQPFLIICDINLPSQNGIEFKRQVDNNPLLRKKSIPFLFMSTHPSKDVIDKAYMELTIQGVFRKSDTFSGLKSMLACIIEYWSECKHPNDF